MVSAFAGLVYAGAAIGLVTVLGPIGIPLGGIVVGKSVLPRSAPEPDAAKGLDMG